MKKKTQIMVCCHKNDFVYRGNGFLPIQVGKALSSLDLGMTSDDTGENISDKNANYCELTAQYWLWKKDVDADFIGLNHYRRYFDFRNHSHGYFFQNISETQATDSRLALPDLTRIFQKCDIILSEPIVYPLSIEMQYALAHGKQDLLQLRNTIMELYPEYIDAYDRFFNQNKISLCNMFVMKKETFMDYSRWLFNILFTVEKKIKLSEDAYQRRIFGFMGERLLNVYAEHHKLRIAYRPILKISEERPLNKYKGILKRMINQLTFFIVSKESECKIRY